MSNTSKKTFIKDTFFYLPGQVITGLMGMLSIAVYSRLFTPLDYGDYSLVMSSVNLLVLFTTSWISQSSLRFSEEYKINYSSFYTSIFLTLLIINISVWIIYLPIIYNINFTKSIVILVVNSLVFFSSYSFDITINSLLRAERHSKLYSLNSSIVAIFNVLLVIPLVSTLKIGAESIFISMAVGHAISATLGAIKLNIFSNISLFSYNFKIIKKFLVFGFPLIGLVIISWILSASDRYLIKIFHDSYQVALYSVNYSLSSNVFSLISNMMMLAAYPIIIKEWNSNGVDSARKVTGNFLHYYLLIAIPAFAGISALASELSALITTSEYSRGSIILPIIGLGMIFLGISQYINKIWELKKKTHILVIINIIPVISNVVLNLIFIPKFGYIAAAYTTLISYLIYLILSLLIVRQVFVVRVYLRRVLRIILSSAFMFILIRVMSGFMSNNIFSLLVRILLGMISYFGFLVLLGERHGDFTNFLKRFQPKKSKK